MKGSARLSLYLKEAVDLVLMTAEMARRGFWVAKVLPAESGFEVLSPEPGLIGIKMEGDQISYKVYADRTGTSVTLFGDADRFFGKVAELVDILQVGGCTEECIISGDLSASFEGDKICDFGTVEVERIGKLKLQGIVARGDGEAVSIVPLNDSSSLMVYTVRGEWSKIKGRALALHTLSGKLWEVLKSWTCRE